MAPAEARIGIVINGGFLTQYSASFTARPHYRWLLFDADGTLFDYDRAEVFALSKTLSAINLDLQPDLLSLYRQINGRLWHEFEQDLVTPDEIKIRRFTLLSEQANINADPERLARLYLINLSQATFLIEDAKATVRALHSRFRLAIITNGLSEVQRPRFRSSPIGRYFELFIISEEVGVSKPDSRIFDLAMNKMDRPYKASVMIIGDSLSSDIAGGVNYGIDTCWFNPGQNPREPDVKPTYEISQLAELLSLPGISARVGSS